MVGIVGETLRAPAANSRLKVGQKLGLGQMHAKNMLLSASLAFTQVRRLPFFCGCVKLVGA